MAGGNVGLGGAAVPSSLPKRSAMAERTVDLRRIESALAWAAHELRGPLLEAQLTLELLLNNADGVADATPRALAERTSRLLETLSTDLHSILRWGAGSASLSRRRVSLGPLAREVARGFADRTIGISGATVVVHADRVALSTAVRNLIRNAAVHAGDDATIEVITAGGPEMATITVRDDGAGIPVDVRDTIFLPFVRGREGRGTGLGLFIARAIAEAHGGTLRLDPTSIGASFTIGIPMQAPC